MFTGLVESIGKVLDRQSKEQGLSFVISCPMSWTNDIRLGDSIAVQGVCLTVVDNSPGQLHFDVIAETVSRTTFDNINIDDQVNLERSMSIQSRFGGHFVQGHVDAAAKILSVKNNAEDYRVKIALPTEFADLVVEKGYVTVDGASLTVAELDQESFTIALIPHTLAHTVSGDYVTGQAVNLEFDVLGKYVVHAIDKYAKVQK